MRNSSVLFSVGAALLTLAGPAAAEMKAGAGRAQITLTPDMLPVNGFVSILDPLYVRVLVLNDGPDRTALVVVDQTSLADADVAEMKRLVTEAGGMPAASVLVGASHTFSAPHLFGANPPAGMNIAPDERERATVFRNAVMDAVRRAATDAVRSLIPARIAAGAGTSHVNVNRNVEMADSWWLGANETGPSDKVMPVARVEDLQGHTIATLTNFPVQSAVMDQTGAPDGGKAVTADLGGATAAHLEAQLGGVSLFLIGAAGDQVPTYAARRLVYDKDGHSTVIDLGAAGYPLVRLQGERLGAAALGTIGRLPAGADRARLGILNGSVELKQQERPRQLSRLRPTRTYKYVVNGTIQAPYSIMRVGDLAIVGVQVELDSTTGAWIRSHSPFPHTMVVTMVNGAAKYLPTAESFKQITYQSMNSSYAPGSAEVLQARIVADLARLHKAR